MRLEARPFRALEILLQNAPEVVSREELQKRLWPEDVFIDFDHGLNKAIGKVRRALNDSADEPRFVETVGRRGYRFIAPLIRPIPAPPDPIPIALVEPPAAASKAPAEEIRDVRPRSWRTFGWAGVAVAVVLLIAFLLRPESPKLQIARILQITKSGDAWPFEPMATDGPRLYFQSLSRKESPGESQLNWRVKQVLLNGNEETVIPGTSGQVHSFRIRGLSSDDTEFLALSRSGKHKNGWPLLCPP